VSRYHLALIVPEPRLHGKAFLEVMDTLAWGLEQLGHRVTRAVNSFQKDATNIVFGAQLLPVDAQKELPRTRSSTTSIRCATFRCAITRSSRKCCTTSRISGSGTTARETSSRGRRSRRSTTVRYVPVGFAPLLCRIAKPSVQDIEVLLYGTTGQERLQVLHELSHRGFTAVYAAGLFGTARDELIGRAKIVLNVNYNNFAKIFEVVRVSYLLANRKAVVADESADSFIDPISGRA
jgi:hypothetical protein